MKKALVLLLALAMVVSAFAQTAVRSAAAPSFTGSATLSWGVTLGTDPSKPKTGFSNASSFAFTFPLVDKASYAKGGENVYGEIKVTDFSFKLVDVATAPATQVVPAGNSIASATLYFKPFSLSVFSAPTLISAVDTTIGAHEATPIVTTAYTGGTKLTYTSDMLTAGLTIVSKGDWTANTKNDYAFSANGTFVAVKDLLSIKAAGAYVPETKALQAAISAPVTLKEIMKGLTITPAADISQVGTADLALDAGAKAVLTLSDKNSSDVATTFTAEGYLCASKKVEIGVAFDEPLTGGLVNDVAFGGSFKMYDTDMNAIAANVGYKYVIGEKDNVVATATFKTSGKAADLFKTNELKAVVTFTDTQIANTTITCTYTSGDLLAETGGKADLGALVVAAKISF